MTFPVFAGSNPSGYNLTRSLRFRSTASAWLNRTFGTPTNNIKWTWSGWVKRGKITGYQRLFGVGSDASGANQGSLGFDTTGFLGFFQGDGSGFAEIYLATSALYRDPSSWYHVVLTYDSSNATSSNRILMYVNGSRITAFSSATYPSSSLASKINVASVSHGIGVLPSSSSNYLDGYLAEVNFIDGQALTPSSFGSTNTLTGVWQPAKYVGTYGNNGFYLPFTDNSGATATTIGKDFSGNGNNWTPNNISITAGVTYDSMTDVPTLTSATAANFSVLNPILQNGWWAAPVRGTITNANLRISGSNGSAFSTFDVATTGKWYLELTITNYGNGVVFPSSIITSARSRNTFEISYLASGVKTINSVTTAYGASWTTGDIIGIAIDKANNQVTFYKNNVSQGAITNTFPSETVLVGYYCETTGSDTIDFNFGQRPFTYTPPTGFVSLNTFNLPTSTIVKGNTVMDATLYTGTGASLSVTNTASFKPDLVWVKSRSAATDHAWYDSVRGTTKQLESNTTTAETTEATGLTTFGSAGFTVGALAQMNTNAATYVGWQWQAGQGTTSTNTNGSITSTVSVNASAGFSVVTYTGTGANATVGHGLGVAPSLIIAKSRGAATNWGVWHTSLTASSYFLLLNTTAAQATAANSLQALPTSTLVSLGASSIFNDASTMVMYCWTPIAGYSAFGSYTGNGSTDGSFVYTGFKPKFVLIKASGLDESWYIYDSARNTYNVVDLELNPNNSGAEATFTTLDFLSNGFKLRTTNSAFNSSGATYIYACFSENPFKNALAR